MLKLRWHRKTTKGETEGSAAHDMATAAGDVATAAGGVTPVLDEVHMRDTLEVIKTAVVWLVVINLLTVLSPLLWLSLKWTIVVGVLLTGGSIAIGCVTYLRARRAQRGLPE